MAEAQIILAHARESGIVAIAQGEEHKRARTALAETGFRRDDDGVYHLPVDGTETMVADLGPVWSCDLAGSRPGRVGAFGVERWGVSTSTFGCRVGFRL